MKNLLLYTICLLLITLNLKCQNPGRISVSENGHYLLDTNGEPFYWLGDTGWAMFQRLTRKEVDTYLDNRVKKGFTLIQSVLFWYPHGEFKPYGPLNETNAYGFRPFLGDANSPDTSAPLLEEGGSPQQPNDYWDHADYVVEAVKKRGLKLVLLPCWGNAYINNRMPGSKIEFTQAEALTYGKFLGKRYKKESHIIWCLGGDVDPVNFGDKDQRAVYRAMAEGIGRGVSGNENLQWDESHPDWEQSLMTFHAVRAPYLSGEGAEGGSSSIWFHQDVWLDFNMMETFQWMEHIHSYVSEDYHKMPTKPTVLGEGAYEIGQYDHECGFIDALKVRRQGYHALFAGAAGYTYGHWSVWPMRAEYCGLTWQQALDAPGAEDVARVMHDFARQQQIFTYVPDSTLIVSDNPTGELYQAAMRSKEGGAYLVYFPENKQAQLNLAEAESGDLQLSWFDPRDGQRLKEHFNPEIKYTPPAGWQDAILIIQR